MGLEEVTFLKDQKVQIMQYLRIYNAIPFTGDLLAIQSNTEEKLVM